MRPSRLLAALLVPLALVGGADCGSEEEREDGVIPGGRLTIYSSQPLNGYEADRAEDLVRAQRLALKEARGRVGRWRISYVVEDDADLRTGRWSPALVAENARRAAQDPTTIAYLGEMDSGASAVAIPVLNEAGILTVSPLDGVAGFTRRQGAGQGEPDKYYPTRKRSFGRLVPPDDVQAAALVTYMQDERVSRLFVAHDDSLYARSLAINLQRRAVAGGVAVLANQGVDPRAVDHRRLAAEVAASGADGFFYAGQMHPGLGRLFQAVRAGDPRVRLFAPSALAHPAFTSQLGPAGAATRLTAPMLASRVLPPAARDFERQFRAAYGSPPDPAAIYGYEAMSLVLDSIRRAGANGNRRRAVIEAFLSTRERASVLGIYDVDANGDTSTQTYGAYRVRGGRPAFDRVLDPLGA